MDKTKIAVVCTLHDNTGRIVENLTSNNWGRWLEEVGYASLDIVATTSTYDRYETKLRLLKGDKVVCWRETPQTYANEARRNSHMQALSLGLARQSNWIFYVDGDRLVADLAVNRFSWWDLHRQLQSIIKEHQNLDMISINRPHGYEGAVRVITETPVNLTLGEISGVQIDPFSSYTLMKQNLAELVFRGARNDYNHETTFPVLEWFLRAVKSEAVLGGMFPVGEAMMVGAYEDTLPTHGDLGGLLAIPPEGSRKLFRSTLGINVVERNELEKRLEIAERAVHEIRGVLGDHESLKTAEKGLAKIREAGVEGIEGIIAPDLQGPLGRRWGKSPEVSVFQGERK